MRIYFQERIAQVKFAFNPEYQSARSFQQNFPNFALIELNQSQPQELKILSSIDPETLSQDWPFRLLKKLPNGKSLPKPLHKSGIYEWKEENISLLLHNDKDLALGGLYQHEDFNFLPKGFFATQKIDDGAGRKATISIFGPSATTQGGIYLVAEFGMSPFELLRSSKPVATLQFDLNATEPLKILSTGRPIWYSLFNK